MTPKWADGSGAGDARGARHCQVFLDRIASMPRELWLAVGHRERASSTSSERTRALASLGRVIGERELAVTAWFVRDALRTAFEIAVAARGRSTSRRSPPRPLTRRERQLAEAALTAAEQAALARVVRPWLTDDEYRVLTESFDAIATLPTGTV